MHLEFSKDQRFQHRPKILQLIDDCIRVYSATPNTPMAGMACVFRLLYWHGILKHTRAHFLGTYFSMPFLYDTSSDGAACLYIYPYIEYQVYRFFKEWIHEGSICFDVGSNVGYYPLLCASRGGFTHSFEANSEMVRLQEINLLLNNFQNRVALVEAAVSDKDGSSNFYRQDNGRALISSLIQDPSTPGEEVLVKSVTLDTYIRSNAITRIDLLKIDVEGGESLVIAGSKDTLSTGVIKAIIWESNYRAPKEDRQNIVETLSKFGYRHYALDAQIKGVRPWIWGDDDCLSIHKSVAKEFDEFVKSVGRNYAQTEQ